MKNLFSALLFAALPGFASAQNYFQQEVNYKINVSLNDDKHELTGIEEIEYINNSPDQLSYIYFHLWPNGYKNTKTAFARQAVRNNSRKFYFAKASERGFIDGLNFEVNGKPVKLEYEQEDVAKIVLNEPLKPGQRLIIKTPFHVKIPGAFSRLGHIGQSYQISQWYPKPAVYDRKGWHQMPYLDQGEFYSEYGSFDVKITLPENYNVGATGVLQTASEIARMDSLAKVGAAKTNFGKDAAFPASASKTKTLHYVQDRVHDFAWFADKRFNILKSEAELPVSKRKVTTWLLFLNQNSSGWVSHKNDINEAITKYSEFVGEYPYASATAVDGALGENVGGMEYPMVTVTMPSAIIHEVGHNWFYGILGSNEREYPWQDEGVNCYVENRMAEEKNPDAGQLSFALYPPFRKFFGFQDLHANALNYTIYQIGNTRGSDQPIQYHSDKYSNANYGGIVYQKTPVSIKYLAAYLGQEKFDQAMHAYFEKWKFKHPYPEDMQAVFEETSGEKLDWFFKDLFQTTKPVDIGIKKAEKTATGVTVTLKNEGEFAAPAPVAGRDAFGAIVEQQWSKPFSGRQTLTFTDPKIERVEVDPDYLLPETDRRDNQSDTKGILRKTQFPRLQPLAGLEQNRKSQLYFLPVIGANTADKFMLGMAFYNSSVAAKKFNYLLMPMYSFNQKELNGIGHFDFNIISRKSSFLRQSIIGFTYNRFEYYRKYEPAVTFNFKQKNPGSARQQVKLGVTYIYQNVQDLIENGLAGGQNPINLLHYPGDYVIPSITYNFLKKDAIQTLNLNAQYLYYSWPDAVNGGNHTAKATVWYERYWNKNNKVNARLFGGKFFTNDIPVFYMGLSGSPDYQRETIFLDRAQKSESIQAFRDQTDGKDGAFKNGSSIFTNNWLTTLNLETEIPYFPLDIYLDLGRVANFNKTFYGTGLSLNIGKGFFSLYLPIAGSNFVNNTPEDFKDFRQNIRFCLRITQFNPFKQLNENL